MTVATRVLTHPLTLTNRLLAQSAAAPTDGAEVREFKRLNYPNLARGLDKLRAAEEAQAPTWVGALYLTRYAPKPGIRPERVRDLAQMTAAHERQYRRRSLLDLVLGRAGTPAVERLDAETVWEMAAELARIADRTHFGLASTRMVTTAGVNYLVDVLQGSASANIIRYHAIGTGGTAEATGDTALVTELSTEYNPASTRATGSLAEGASSNIYRSVGTNLVSASVTITEHGLMTQQATGGGTLLDRTLFSGVALTSGNSLQTTFELSLNAGS